MAYAGDPRFKFSHPIRVRFRDTDSQGVVNYANYYFFFAEAIFEYYRTMGCSLKQLNDAGYDLVVAHSEADYKGGARLEELLQVWTRVASVRRSSIGNEHIIAAEDGRPLVYGRVTQVVVDLHTGRPTEVPEFLREALRRMEGADLNEAACPGGSS